MVEPDASEPSPVHAKILMSCAVSFDGLTWGTLRSFVAIADKWGVDDAVEVGLDIDPDDDTFVPTGLRFDAFDVAT